MRRRHYRTNARAVVVRLVYMAETLAEHGTVLQGKPLSAHEIRRRCELIRRAHPELRGVQLDFQHAYGQGRMRGCLTTMQRPDGSLAFQMRIHSRSRYMSTLLHELAHLVHVRRIGYAGMARLVQTGEDHNAEWRGILLDLCAKHAVSFGMALRKQFRLAGLEVTP
jgi:hypothetical protein